MKKEKRLKIRRMQFPTVGRGGGNLLEKYAQLFAQQINYRYFFINRYCLSSRKIDRQITVRCSSTPLIANCRPELRVHLRLPLIRGRVIKHNTIVAELTQIKRSSVI